jgi:hypothetical protein
METDPLDTDLSHDFSSMRPHLGSQEINPQQQPTPLKKSSQDLEKLPPFKVCIFFFGNSLELG